MNGERSSRTATTGRSGRPVPPLLPDRARRPAAVVLAACVVVIAAGGAAAAGKADGNALDRPIDSWIRQHIGSHPGILHVAADLGPILAVALAPLVIVLCLRARRLTGAFLVAIAVPLALAVTEYVLKPLVHETINGALAYPSGHTASVFSLATAVTVLLLNPPGDRPERRRRIAIIAVGVLIGCCVAVAMIGLNYHYFTDTVAGAAVGTAAALATALVLDVPGVRASPRRR